ncbi:hypothetical protein B0A50_03014 [Salinomyces thailandicus]|uniref:Aminoglycoside phosphotransferase domain-containing protein n=1 Tax=Salinomyces thailandicus TaxID=706561 RepID=A0A4U0U1K9_9PEZI|nr:hypothetical protein B0A50_03014 [Salinomyces thailandica]
MWEPIALPFKNDTAPSLPTTEEIRACPFTLAETSVTKVVAVNDEVIAKFGGGIDVCEGQALVYLERHVPEVPAPRLYAMYRDSEQVFLIMQRAPGVELDSVWPSLTEPEKDSIIANLRRIFDSMRRTECPWPDFFGSLDGGSAHHELFYSQKGDERFLGPFYGEAAFVTGLTQNFRALTESNWRPDFKVRYYEAHLGGALQNFRPTLTHGDVHKKNIMVAEIPSAQENKRERSFHVPLVDWAMAGWYPEFWEYFCASRYIEFLSWEEDWCWRVGQFLPVLAAKTVMMRMFDKDME